MRPGEVVAVVELKEVVTEEKFVTVTMPLQDARDILGISHCVGGSPNEARGAMDRLAHALLNIGVERTEVVPKDPSSDMARGRMFYYKGSQHLNG